MRRDITIERYRDGDEAEIIELYNEVFGATRDLSVWRWKFVDAPLDSRPFILVAKHDGRIIGQYACLALPLKYRDQTAVAVYAVDNMIRRDYRGGIRGVQTQLFARSRKLWTESDCDLVWGFPSPAAYTVGKRLLEYDRRIEIVNLYRLLSGRAIARKILNIAPATMLADWVGRWFVRWHLRARTRRTRRVNFRRVEAFDARVDALWQRVRSAYPVAIERTRAYLNWRYATNPEARYDLLQAERGEEVLGLIVARACPAPPERVGLILDCLAIDDPEVLPGLVSHALLALSAEGADHVLVRFAAGDPMRRPFERLGFRQRSGLWDEVAVYRRYSDLMTDEVVGDASNWLISFGDCDSL